MCGRYAFFTDNENAEITKTTELITKKYGEGKIPNGEIFPSNTAPVLLVKTDIIDAELLNWGFMLHNKKDLIINARAETAKEKRMFSKSLISKRCILPSTGFYEWSSLKKAPQKQKYLFTLPNASALYMAGLYNEFEGMNRFVILTTQANASMAEVHNRMPVVVQKQQLKAWLYDTDFALNLLDTIPPELVKTIV